MARKIEDKEIKIETYNGGRWSIMTLEEKKKEVKKRDEIKSNNQN